MTAQPSEIEPIPAEVLAWLRQSAAVDGAAYSQVLLRLLERVEALERRPIPGTVELAAPTPEAAPVATDAELCAVAELERFSQHAWRACYDLGRQHGAAQPPAAQPVAPVSDSKMSAYNHRAAARFAIMDRLEKAIDFSSHGWKLTPEGEHWTRLMAEQGEDEYEVGL